MSQAGHLGEYTCPFCDLNLSNVNSSYLRQEHVEKCLTSSSTLPVELDFDECIFCGKYLSHFKHTQKQVHLNSCLDEITEEQVEEEEEVFAGQTSSFLFSLEICPVCHLAEPFVSRQVSQKLKHIKKCAKENRVSLNQLIQKFQWIGWGHLPIQSMTTTSTDIEEMEETPLPTPAPSHRLKTSFIPDEQGMDDDFSTDVIIHRTNNSLHNKRNREEDKNDEELQLALSISKSLSMPIVTPKKKKIGLNSSNERDWNAARICSIEESNKLVIASLDKLLFPEDQTSLFEQNERERSIGYFNASNIKPLPVRNLKCSNSRNSNFYWDLCSNKNNIWEESFVFTALFLRK